MRGLLRENMEEQAVTQILVAADDQAIAKTNPIFLTPKNRAYAASIEPIPRQRSKGRQRAQATDSRRQLSRHAAVNRTAA